MAAAGASAAGAAGAASAAGLPKVAAVLGSGIMGAGIAALLADLGMEVQLYDLDQALVDKALARLGDPKTKPPALMGRRSLRRIAGYPISAMPERLGQADLIIEAVPEVLAIKRDTYDRVEAARKPGSIVATNTSGLSVRAMAEGRSAELRRSFVGLHFFNPPRYMALVEVIPTADTDPRVVAAAKALLYRAGKTPILGRDTPNFVANRIGIFAMMKALALTERYRLPIEEVDLITAAPIGCPKTGTFRLADLVGIDTLVHVAQNAYDHCPDDEARDSFRPTPLLQRLVAEKRLGDKTGAGFYRKSKAGAGERVIEGLDLATGEYRAPLKARSDAAKLTKGYQRAEDRVKALFTVVDERDALADLARELVVSTGAYALRRVGEIADDAATIDEALRAGFGRDLGPIETLDAIGLERARKWMERFRVAVPEALDRAIAAGEPLVRRPGPRPGAISLGALRDSGAIVRENLSARLIDLGDGVLCCELDQRMVPTMNPVDDAMVAMLEEAHEEIGSGRFRALVVANQAANFSAGANLHMVLELAKAKRFGPIREVCRRLQEVNLRNLHAPYPVITAPHGLTLGGGLEIALGGQVRVAHAELYCGQVEVGVGLVPAGGGCYFLLRQLIERAAKRSPGPMPAVAEAFELIGFGTVSSSAFDAMEKGLLAPHDVVVFAKDEQVARAKEVALARLAAFQPIPKAPLLLPGEGGRLPLEDRVAEMRKSGQISEHSARIARVQARILTGGDRASIVQPIAPEAILELEREAFVELVAEKLTQERMAHMLKHSKPLIN